MPTALAASPTLAPLALLQQFHELGVILTPYPDGTVRCRAPKGVLTPALPKACASTRTLHGPWRPSRSVRRSLSIAVG
jgi:hypothetical protein